MVSNNFWYVQHGQSHDAPDSFKRMRNEGLSLDVIMFICTLKACGSMGAIDKGNQIHDEVVKRKLLEKNIVLDTALVHMFARCGMLEKARKVLKELHIRDVIAWSALIAGCAQQGQGHEAQKCLNHMESEGISLDNITLLCVLSACAHSRLLNNAKMLFEIVTTKYCISPNLQHLNCMVVVFACGNQYDKSISVVKAIPFFEYSAIWI